MCPPRSPGRGSGSVPTKRPPLRASMTCSLLELMLATMSSSVRTCEGAGGNHVQVLVTVVHAVSCQVSQGAGVGHHVVERADLEGEGVRVSG